MKLFAQFPCVAAACVLALFLGSDPAAAAETTVSKKALTWLEGERMLAEEELQALKAHEAEMAGLLRQAEGAEALAINVNDQEALPVAREAAAVARIALTRAAERVVRQEGILLKLQTAISWGEPPRDGPIAVPVLATGVVMRKVGSGWQPIGAGPIRRGDEIRTGHNGRVDLYFEDGCRVHLRPNTTFLYTGTMYQLLKGKIHNLIVPVPGAIRGELIRHRTITAVVAVRGTEFDLAIDERGLTHLTPYSGTVELAADAEGMQGVRPDRWWEGAGTTRIDLGAGYTALLAAGTELEIGKDAEGEPAYVLHQGRVYVFPGKEGETAPAPRIVAANAVVTPVQAAFEVSLGGDGLADIVPLAGMVEVRAVADGTAPSFWKE